MYDAHQLYQESEILSAEPLKLVEILYRTGIDALGRARRALASGDVEERGRAVQKTCDVLIELLSSLNKQAGELATNLARLYDYILVKVVDGHARASDGSFAEAERLMMTLYEAWHTLTLQESSQTTLAPAQPEPVSCSG